MLAMSLLCLVLFFVFAQQPESRWLGLVLADGAHCALLLVSLVAMAIGVYRFDKHFLSAAVIALLTPCHSLQSPTFDFPCRTR